MAQLPQRVGWYIVTFAILSLGGLVPVYNLEVLVNDQDGWDATLIPIIRHMREVAIVSTAYSFIVVEGTTMLAEIFLKNREEKGRQEGQEEERKRILKLLDELPPEERERAKKLLEERDSRED